MNTLTMYCISYAGCSAQTVEALYKKIVEYLRTHLPHLRAQDAKLCFLFFFPIPSSVFEKHSTVCRMTEGHTRLATDAVSAVALVALLAGLIGF